MSDNTEIVEYGENHISMLMLAVKRLYEGLSAVKISLDTLNETIYNLKETIASLEKDFEKLAKQITEERKLIAANLEKFASAIEERTKTLNRDLKLTLDVFIEDFRQEVKKAAEVQQSLSIEIAELKTVINELKTINMDSWSRVESDIETLRSKHKETELLLKELSSDILGLNSDVNTRIKELELLLEDVSTRLSYIETQISQHKNREKAREEKKPS